MSDIFGSKRLQVSLTSLVDGVQICQRDIITSEGNISTTIFVLIFIELSNNFRVKRVGKDIKIIEDYELSDSLLGQHNLGLFISELDFHVFQVHPSLSGFLIKQNESLMREHIYNVTVCSTRCSVFVVPKS